MKKIKFFIALFFIIPMYVSAQGFHSNHFMIQKLSEGVYAAIAKNGGYAICNAGIIDLGDATLIFDPFMTPEAAEDLKKAAEQLTGHKVNYVVNSHYHNDHIGGNQVFPDAIIISTVLTRDLIAKYQPLEIEEDKTGAPVELEKFNNKDTSKMTKHELEENIMWKGYYEALVTSNSSLKTIVPNKTFNGQLVIHGTKLTLKLLSYGIGHTESDLFLFLPKLHIAFLGDLLFIQNQPWLGDGNADKWKIYLDRIALLKPKIVVPGHGPVGNVSQLDTMKLYFQNVKDAAASYYKNGKQPKDDANLQSPEPYNGWFLSNFYKPNVISEYGRLYKK